MWYYISLAKRKLMQINNNNLIKYSNSYTLTIEQAQKLQNEIKEIWEKIAWEESNKKAERGLSDEEICKIESLSNYASTLSDSSSDLKTFAEECLQRFYTLNEKIEQNYEKALEEAVYHGARVSIGIKTYWGLSEEQLHKIAWIAVANEGEAACYITNYGIKDPERLFELAKRSAQSYSHYASKYIANFGLNQAQRIEVAKIAMRFPLASELIKNYDIQDQMQRFEVAKVAANVKGYGEGISKNIEMFELNPNQLFEIALLVAKNEGPISKFIQNYGIQFWSPEQIFEVAKIAAKNSEYPISEYIPNYNIQDLEKLFEIAQINASFASNISELIKNYVGLSNTQLFEVAKIAAKRSGRACSKCIKNYGLSEAQRFEVAKLSAESSESFSEFIENYELINSLQLIMLAEIAAKTFGGSTSKHIHKYNIQDKEQLLRIAKIAVTSFGASEFIKNYGIDNSLQRFEIAKIAAEKETYRWDFFPEYLQNYEIQEPSHLIELAKIAAKKRNNQVSRYIKKFGIHDQEALAEIAKISASVDPWDMSRYIQEYGIKDPDALYEIAKIAAAISTGTSQFIKNFDIKDQSRLFEIAEISAKLDGFSNYVQNYELQNEEQRLELAQTVRIHNPSNLQYLIENFNLSEKNRYEILKLLSKKFGPLIFTQLFSSFKITNPEWNFELAKLALIKQVSLPNSLRYVNRYKLSLEQKIELFLLASVIVPHEIQALIKNIEELENETPKNLPAGFQLMLFPERPIHVEEMALIGPLLRFDNPNISETARNNLRKWMGYVHLLIEKCRKKDSDGFSKFMKEFDCFALLEAIGELRSPNKRNQLVAMLFKYFFEDNIGPLQVYQNLKEIRALGRKDAPIFRFLLASLIHEHQNEAGNSINRKQLDSNWNVVFSSMGSSTYKDATAKMSVINCLYSLIHNKQLNVYEKVHFIWQIFGLGVSEKNKRNKSKIVNRNLRFAEAIISADNVGMLKQFVGLRPKALSLAKNSLQGCLQKIFHDIVGKVILNDFSEKFDETFMKSRQPYAFLTYGTILKKVPEAIPYLREAYVNILEGTFSKLRYESGEHLSKVFSWKEGLKEAWMKGKRIPLSEKINEADEKSKADNGPDCRKYLFEKICQDKHFPATEFVFLGNCLQNPSFINAALEEILKEKFQNNVLERSLLNLFNPELHKDEKLSFLDTAINNLAREYPDNAQFLQDLKDLSKLITESGKLYSYKGWTIEDTDSWEDLLLSGTEVLGSCQNVNGDANLNKALLNYLLDGKNRIVVLKDGEGKIRARIVLRLLIDKTLKRPVLYRERLYKTPGISESALEALYQMCVDRANELGLSLMRSKEEGEILLPSQRYPNDIVSLNGHAPFEYVDAEVLGITDGCFSISPKITRLLFDPMRT